MRSCWPHLEGDLGGRIAGVGLGDAKVEQVTCAYAECLLKGILGPAGIAGNFRLELHDCLQPRNLQAAVLGAYCDLKGVWMAWLRPRRARAGAGP